MRKCPTLRVTVTEVFTFVADVVSGGFFTPEASSPATAGSHDFARIHVAGLGKLHQFFRVAIASDVYDERTEHVVVSAYEPLAQPEALADTVRRLLPACGRAALSVIVADQVGWSKVASFSPEPPECIAACVAFTKASGGWDESDPIVVEVGALTFYVSPVFIDDQWQLAVRGD